MAIDSFVELGPIKGESKDSGHKDWLQVESMNMSLHNSGDARTNVGAAKASGRVTYSDITFTMRMDKASAKLAEYCTNGNTVPKAKIEFQTHASDSKPHVYLKIELENVLISSYSVSSSSEYPYVSFGINFSTIKYEYIGIDEKNKPMAGIEYGWNIPENKKL